MNIDYNLIGNRIKEERRKKGMTQEELAERLDVSIGYISQVERGITKISLDLLGSISGIFNVDVASFITESSLKQNDYMYGDLHNRIMRLSAKQRKILGEFIDIIEKY